VAGKRGANRENSWAYGLTDPPRDMDERAWKETNTLHLATETSSLGGVQGRSQSSNLPCHEGFVSPSCWHPVRERRGRDWESNPKCMVIRACVQERRKGTTTRTMGVIKTHHGDSRHHLCTNRNLKQMHRPQTNCMTVSWDIGWWRQAEAYRNATTCKIKLL
jgi:hypothetical protein